MVPTGQSIETGARRRVRIRNMLIDYLTEFKLSTLTTNLLICKAKVP